ncbi:TetR family transcriptional regulator C-terminal domain-containing protein [Streptomyces sp. NPDC003077]|uniref:TetR/AcrR family transcriptional regulator n=1 Tax=Streptomyces sp. NPDC003077 TaxID=3154443 RepID=UPI0033AEC45D
MPKVVDHADRRRRLTEAVWTLTIRDGLEGVTLRKVATEAGVSMGQVQHYYGTMQELVRDAMLRAVNAVNARIEASLQAAGTTDAEAALRACLQAMLARDEEGARLLRLGVATLSRSITDPDMARVLDPGDDDELLSFTSTLIAAAREARGAAPGGDHLIEADICWTLAASLGVDVMRGARSPEDAQKVLDHYLDSILG